MMGVACLALDFGDEFVQVFGEGSLTFGVRAELHEHEVARFEKFADGRPAASHKACGGGAADGAVDEVGLRWVDVDGKGISPAPLAIDAVAAAVAHGRVADEKDRREVSCRELRGDSASD